MPRSRYKILTEGKHPYFITSSVVNWTPVFGNTAIANIVFESLAFLQKQKRLSLHAYVLMENHLHLIVSADDLAKEMRNFKSFTARKSIDWYQEHNKQWILGQLREHRKHHKTDQSYQFWQEGFHPKLIQTDVMLQNKLEYIHNNPVERGFIDDPAHWRYSSYRNYMGLEGVIGVEPLL